MNFFDCTFNTSRKKLLYSYAEYWRCLFQYYEMFARLCVNEDFHKPMRICNKNVEFNIINLKYFYFESEYFFWIWRG